MRFIKKLSGVVLGAAQQFFADQCPQHAAAIAYRVLFSAAPLAIVLVSVFGLVLEDDRIREDVVSTIVEALPVSVAGRKDVEDAITAIATPATAAGLLSLVLFAWAATGMMAAVRQGLERAMGVTESRPLARGKLVDLLLIVGAAALTLVIVAITLLGDVVRRADWMGVGSGVLASLVTHGATFAVSILVVLLLYRFVPARGLRIRDGVVGAVVTALCLVLISLASGWIYAKTSRFTVVYGSLTAALVFLYSMYLCAAALLLGAETAAAWARPPVPETDPAAVQLRRAVLGLFVSQDDARRRG